MVQEKEKKLKNNRKERKKYKGVACNILHSSYKYKFKYSFKETNNHMTG